MSGHAFCADAQDGLAARLVGAGFSVRGYDASQQTREQVRAGVERELRPDAELAIAPGSSLPLVLIRSALPKLEMKAAARWAAALEMAGHEGLALKHFIGFLREIGGIESAHRRRARIRKKNLRH